MLGVVGSNLKMVKFFTQHLWMLHDIVVVWPGSCNNVAAGHAQNIKTLRSSCAYAYVYVAIVSSEDMLA